MVALAVATIAGCSPRAPTTGPADPSTSPSAAASVSRPGPSATPPVAGLSWTTANAVERPSDAFAIASAPPSEEIGPNTAGHPGHFPGQAIVSDVVDAGGTLVAVGYVGLEGTWRAIAWTSADGMTWRMADVDPRPASFAMRIAAAADGLVVAVGRTGSTAVAWSSRDGVRWTAHALPAGGTDWERATAVAALPGGGFLVGGSAGPELGYRRARLWRSGDSASWVPERDAASFADGEITGLAVVQGGELAVARLGTGQRSTGSAAWRRDPDGTEWRPADGDLGAGLMNSVTAGRGGTLIAVGSDSDERAAIVWRSTDGRTWRIVPTSPALSGYEGKIRMLDVTTTAAGFVAVGNTNPLQFGTATSWVSADGSAWRRAPAYAALEQGEMLAVADTTIGLVAVGSFGAPDNYIPTIWNGASAR